MATVKCPLGKRGRPSHEWHDGEKSRIYCQGWIDSMTDEYLEACKNCPDHVNKAQDDLDKWNAEHRNGQQLAAQKRLIYAEDLFEPVDAKVFVVGGRSGGKTMAMYEQLFRKRVEMAPTIDAVHAAGGCYCRECRYLQQDTHGLWCFRDYENPLKLDGFCSYGERWDDHAAD